MKTAGTVTEPDLLYIPLVNGKDFACLGPAFAVNKTMPLFQQHGARNQQVAAGPTLPTGTLTQNELVLNIILSKINQQKPSHFTDKMNHKAGF